MSYVFVSIEKQSHRATASKEKSPSSLNGLLPLTGQSSRAGTLCPEVSFVSGSAPEQLASGEVTAVNICTFWWIFWCHHAEWQANIHMATSTDNNWRVQNNVKIRNTSGCTRLYGSPEWSHVHQRSCSVQLIGTPPYFSSLLLLLPCIFSIFDIFDVVLEPWTHCECQFFWGALCKKVPLKVYKYFC